MKPYAIPLRASPVMTMMLLSGSPNINEGPCNTIEAASIMNDTRISNLLGNFPTMKFTSMQLIVYAMHGSARMGPNHTGSIFFSFLSTSVRNAD